jgi:Tol biopolymer transport system component
MIKPDGMGFEELTTGGRNNAFPSFAPDGKRFVFRTFENDGYGLRIMNLRTKAGAPSATPSARPIAGKTPNSISSVANSPIASFHAPHTVHRIP